MRCDASADCARREPPLTRKAAIDSNAFGVTFLFLQGILGGLALMSLYMFFLLDAANHSESFLRFYSPLAMTFSRTFFTLLVLSLLGAFDKFNKDWMVNFEPAGPSRCTADICLLVLYVIALVCSVINTPFDDVMHYSYRRTADWYTLELSSDFKSEYSVWYALSLIKVVTAGLAWALLAYELRPPDRIHAD